MAIGSVMPWVDPETVGPQRLAYYAWNFGSSRSPNILPDQRHPLRAGDPASLDDGCIHRRGAAGHGLSRLRPASLGQKIEYRETFARFEPFGNGALRESTRYWTPDRAEQPAGRLQRHAAVQPRLRGRPRHSLPCDHGLAVFYGRARAVEAAAPKAGEAPCERGEAAAAPPRLAAAPRRARLSRRAGAVPTRLRVEMSRCSPARPDRPLALRVGNSAALLVVRPVDSMERRIIRPLPQRSAAFASGSPSSCHDRRFLWRRAGLARARPQAQRDHRFDAGAELGRSRVPKMAAIFVGADRQPRRDGSPACVYQLIQGAREFGIAQYLGWFILPAAIDGL